MKKLLSAFLSLIMMISAVALPAFAFAADDSTAPIIDVSSLNITLPDGKESVEIGDTVSVSFRVSDESEFKAVAIVFISPIKQREEFFNMDEYDSETKTAKFSIPITNETEYGQWKLLAIGAMDVYENMTMIYSDTAQDIPEGSDTADFVAYAFTVDESEQTLPDEDETAPNIDVSSLKAEIKDSKESAKAKDTVKISVLVSDDSQIGEVTAYYSAPVSSISKRIDLEYNSISGKYECNIEITDSTEAGIWEMKSISAQDANGNIARIFSNKVEGEENTADLSAGNYRVVRSISGVQVQSIADHKYTGAQITPEPVVRDNGLTLVNGRDFTFSYKNNVKAGKATVIITGTGSYTDAIEAYFNILSPPVVKPTVTKPKASKITKLVKGKKKITVKWKKISGVTGYQIQYSTNKKFKSAKKKTVKGAKKYKLTVKKLKAKKKYYVRVRTYKKVNGKTYYSSWSKSKAVKTK